MINYNFKCKTCTERFSGCHSVCESYITAKEEGLKEKKRIDEIKTINRELNSFRYEGARKALRYH